MILNLMILSLVLSGVMDRRWAMLLASLLPHVAAHCAALTAHCAALTLVLLACLTCLSCLSAVIDPTSPIFMRGDTIHIPCVFISWTGLALDEKTPLLRAEQVRSLFLVTSLS